MSDVCQLFSESYGLEMPPNYKNSLCLSYTPVKILNRIMALSSDHRRYSAFIKFNLHLKNLALNRLHLTYNFSQIYRSNL